MKKEEVLELIKNGENSRVEFKDERIKPGDLAKEIVAFANSEGGTILIGVDDQSNIVGFERKDMEEWVINICRNNCQPSLVPLFETVSFDEKTVAVVTVPKREGIVHRTPDGHYYIRVGSTVRDASPEELARLFQFGGYVHHDVSPVYNTSLSDLDQERLKTYFSQRLGLDWERVMESPEDLLRNIRAMVEMEGKSYLTVAGLLVFGHHPERHLPQAGITAVKFRGREMDYEVKDKMEISGPLVNRFSPQGEVASEGVIEEAIRFVRNNTPTSSKMEGPRRVELPCYPPDSIREAIVNAVAHRNYAITGSRIRLLIFSDRIEIRSPGSLPNTVTLENIKRTAHYTRNPELYKLLAQHGYAEDIGLGIPQKIIRKMIEHTGREPGLEENGEEFVLTLFAGEKDG